MRAKQTGYEAMLAIADPLYDLAHSCAGIIEDEAIDVQFAASEVASALREVHRAIADLDGPQRMYVLAARLRAEILVVREQIRKEMTS